MFYVLCTPATELQHMHLILPYCPLSEIGYEYVGMDQMYEHAFGWTRMTVKKEIREEGLKGWTEN